MADQRSDDPFAFLERAELHVPRDETGPRPAMSYAQLGPETLVDRWCLKTVLGAGGFGVVYEAMPNEGEGDPVAIKLVAPEPGLEGEPLRRLEQEAKVASSIRHPHVVRAFQHGALADGTRYLVMELLDGETLRDRLAARRGLPRDALAGVVRGMGEGLGALHEVGVVHRDVKPANVMLGEPTVGDEAVKLIDLGLCKGPMALTASQQQIGTVAYMPPEALRGGLRSASSATDVYGLALTAYEAATGWPLFEAPSLAELVAAVLRGPEPSALERLHAELPAAFVELVLQGMGPVSGRPRNIAAYGRALAAAARA